MDVREVLDAAKNHLGQNVAPLLDYLAKCGAVNLESYLQKKIVEVGDSEQVRDHVRVLKYALNFCLGGAKVTFVQESSESGVKTPDLKIAVEESQFYVEVKRLRFREESVQHPVSKIVDAVRWKRRQLPPSEAGFVAIDNFDFVGLESGDEGGLTHDHLVKALCELQRLAAENPGGWEKPGGVIIGANTTGGAVAGPVTAAGPEIPISSG